MDRFDGQRAAVRLVRRMTAGVVACVLAAGLGGCASLGYSGGPLTASSADGSARLVTNLPTGVYVPIDENTADIYLTDLPVGRLSDPKDTLSDVRGMVVHLHLFLVPRAGRTPIDATASNAAVRLIVISDGAVGVYGGGGFIQPSSAPGEETLGGGLAEASLRLLRATPDFTDKLGPSILAGAVSAKRDEAMAAVMAGRVSEWIGRSKPIAPAKGSAMESATTKP